MYGLETFFAYVNAQVDLQIIYIHMDFYKVWDVLRNYVNVQVTVMPQLQNESVLQKQ